MVQSMVFVETGTLQREDFSEFMFSLRMAAYMWGINGPNFYVDFHFKLLEAEEKFWLNNSRFLIRKDILQDANMYLSLRHGPFAKNLKESNNYLLVLL